MTKYYTNNEIAELLRSVAAAYEIKDALKNKFRIIAYQRAADAVEHASSELKDLWDDGKLEEVPGIGPNIAEHLGELFKTGKSKHFDSVMKGLPPAMFELMKLPGIGAKTAYKLTTELKLKSESDLEKAAKAGKIAGLEGFGEESQADILKTIEENKGKVKRHLLPYAESLANDLILWLKKNEAVIRADPLGSLRRKAATVGDIDISVATNKPEEVISHFSKYPKAVRILEKGERTASIILPGNVQVDIMVQEPESYGSLLQHFTGSKHHNIALREYAIKKGLSLSEYGIKEVRKSKHEIRKFDKEEKFYNFLGLSFIPPELREDTGEIEAARENKIPKLVEVADVRADLQIHSDFDIETSHDIGESSMEEIIKVAGELEYEYLAFTEHNPSKSGHNEKEIINILKRKKEVIDRINSKLKESARLQAPEALATGGLVKSVKINDVNNYSGSLSSNGRIKKVFNSLEIDILPDGALPVPEEALNFLDFALVSVHSSFRLNRFDMTKRILSSLAHPKVKIFAHPTARKINEREGIELNWPEIFAFCSERNKWLEINADPMRLDLPDTLVKEAVKAGVKLTLGTDAHHKNGLRNMPFGVSVARRGWATKDDIINTRSLVDFEKLLSSN